MAIIATRIRPSVKLPLRERKKIETRSRIVEVANAMFRERGFAGTTLDQIADEANIPVLCYGLRTDFQGALFEGAAALLAIADRLVELRAVCHCGAKATMNLRIDANGSPVRDGVQTEIGGNDRYVALCRRHFRESLDG